MDILIKITTRDEKFTKKFHGGAVFRGAIFLGGFFLGGNFPGGNFPWGNFPGHFS